MRLKFLSASLAFAAASVVAQETKPAANTLPKSNPGFREFTGCTVRAAELKEAGKEDTVEFKTVERRLQTWAKRAGLDGGAIKLLKRVNEYSVSTGGRPIVDGKSVEGRECTEPNPPPRGKK